MIIAMVSGITGESAGSPEAAGEAGLCRSRAPSEAPAAPRRGRASRAGADRAADGQAPIAKAGKQIAKVCAACHTFDKGGPNRSARTSSASSTSRSPRCGGYQPSPTALQGAKGETWDLDKLNDWLCKPQDFAKGTKMTFAGLPKAQDRADVIAYLGVAEVAAP